MNTITSGMISQEMIKKFKDLYFRKYNIKLSNEEATGITIDLVNLMKILLKPTPNK